MKVDEREKRDVNRCRGVLEGERGEKEDVCLRRSRPSLAFILFRRPSFIYPVPTYPTGVPSERLIIFSAFFSCMHAFFVSN
jgi:hypothetical protein